jgi:hypothetical protein
MVRKSGMSVTAPFRRRGIDLDIWEMLNHLSRCLYNDIAAVFDLPPQLLLLRLVYLFHNGIPRLDKD